MAEIVEGLVAREGDSVRELLLSLPHWDSMHWEECFMPPRTTKHILQSTIKQILCIGSTETMDVFARLTRVYGTWTPSVVIFRKDECKFTVTSTTPSLELGEIVDKQGEASSVVLHSPFCDMKFPTAYARKKFMDLIRWYFLARGEITSIGKLGLESFASALCKALKSISGMADANGSVMRVPIGQKAKLTQVDGSARDGEGEGNGKTAKPLDQPKEAHRKMSPDQASPGTEYKVLCWHIVRQELAHVPDALPFVDGLRFQRCDNQNFLPLELLVGHGQKERGVYARLLKRATSPYALRFTDTPWEWLHPFDQIYPQGSITSNVDELGALIKYYFIAKGVSNNILVSEGGGFETHLMLVFGEMARRLNLRPINNARDPHMSLREDSAIAVDLPTNSIRTQAGHTPAANVPQNPRTSESPVQQTPTARTTSPHSSTVVQSASETPIEGAETPQDSVPADSVVSTQLSNTTTPIRTPAETSATPSSVILGTDSKAEDAGFDDINREIVKQEPTSLQSNDQLRLGNRLQALHRRSSPTFSQKDIDVFMSKSLAILTLEDRLVAHAVLVAQCESEIATLEDRKKAIEIERAASIKAVEKEEVQRLMGLISVSGASSIAQITELTRQSEEAKLKKTAMLEETLQCKKVDVLKQSEALAKRLKSLEEERLRADAEIQQAGQELEKMRASSGAAFLIELGKQWGHNVQKMMGC